MDSNDEIDARLMFAFAHDLRDYLRTVTTRIELVQRSGDPALSAPDAEWLSEAVAAARDMDLLITAMVDYCGVAPTRETMPLGLVLRVLRVQVDSLIRNSGAALFFFGNVDARVSRALITVLRELVANACKFCKTVGGIGIQVHTALPDDQNVEIVVRDNGQGLHPDYLDKLFLPFRRMHSRSEFPGFGLGLARCRRIVEANGGSIRAFIPPEGGFAVRIILPAE